MRLDVVIVFGEIFLHTISFICHRIRIPVIVIFPVYFLQVV
jgi:hypothetical protein